MKRNLIIFAGVCLWFGIFTLIGADFHHDGIMLAAAADVSGGALPFRDTFCQYGVLVPVLQALAVRLFGAEILVIRLLTVLFYAGSVVLADRLYGRFLSPLFRNLTLALYFLLAPFLMVVFHPWSSVYALFFMLLSAEFLILFLERGKGSFLCAAGAASAAAFLCRTPCGILSLCVLFFMLFLNRFREAEKSSALRSFGPALAGSGAVLGIFAFYLALSHSRHDYFLQCFAGIFSFAAQRGAAGGGAEGFFPRLIGDLFPFVSSLGFADMVFALFPLAVWFLLIGAVKRGTMHNLPLIALLLTAAVSHHQYFPVSCVRHLYWSAFPMFGAYMLVMQKCVSSPGKKAVRTALTVLLAVPLLIAASVRLCGAWLRLGSIPLRRFSAVSPMKCTLLLPPEERSNLLLQEAFRRIPENLRSRGVLNLTKESLFSLMLPRCRVAPYFSGVGASVGNAYEEAVLKTIARYQPVILDYAPDSPLMRKMQYRPAFRIRFGETDYFLLVPRSSTSAVREGR